ncbi:MAG TPA: hypothetical protein VK824_02835 [Planctomycetota bacterium]|nr:hypothetical protein [Planctomycetota bacterium]
MDPKTFLNTAQLRLHPEPYSCKLDPHGSPFDLILWRRRARFADDVLGVLEFHPDSEPRAQIEAARADIASRFRSVCFTREVVLHLLVHGREPAWRGAQPAMVADRLGFRGVMIQSVHFVDPETLRFAHSVSAWGPVKYALRGHVLLEQIEGLLQPRQLEVEQLASSPEAAPIAGQLTGRQAPPSA